MRPRLLSANFGQRTNRRLLALLVLFVVLSAVLIRVFLLDRTGTLKEIQARGVWRVAMDPSFPPFENFDASTNQVVGLDVDLARAISQQWGIEAEIVSLGFDELLDAVAAHRVDAAISALPIQLHRTKEVRFSDPYVQAGTVLVAREGSAIRATSDLVGHRVAVEWGSQGDAEARRMREGAEAATFELLPSETVTAALDAVVDGVAEAAIVDAISLATYGRNQGLVAVGEPIVSDPYVVVVPADAPDLLRAVNEALTALETEGTLDAIRDRWLRPFAS